MDETELLTEGIISETADETAEQTQTSDTDDATALRLQLEEAKQKEKRMYATLGKLSKKVEELSTAPRQSTQSDSNTDEDYLRKIAREEARNESERDRSERLREKEKEAFLKKIPDWRDYLDRVENIRKLTGQSYEEAYMLANPTAFISQAQKASPSIKMADSTGSSSDKPMTKEEKTKLAAEYLDSLGG